MENAPQESMTCPPTILSDPRLLAMFIAVSDGLSVLVAIRRFFGSKKEYYAAVSLTDKLFMRRLAQGNVSRRIRGGDTVTVIKVGVVLEVERHEAVGRRTEQLSLQKGRLVTTNEYINSLIAADLRITIDSN